MSPIQVTKNAWKKMANILTTSNHNYGFIYSASSGGCNGFNFNLNLFQEEDFIKIKNQRFITQLSNGDTKLYIDPLSEMYLFGTTIDYISEDYKKGIFESKFVFQVDPNQMTSCGCGISFSPK